MSDPLAQFGLTKIKPLVIKGYNDRRDTMQIQIPNEEDMGDDPFGRGYARLQREWLVALQRAVEDWQEGEADGVSADENAGTLLVHWRQATEALEQFAAFCERYWKVLGPGPGLPHEVCLLCNFSPVRQSGADLCLNCAVNITTTQSTGK